MWIAPVCHMPVTMMFAAVEPSTHGWNLLKLWTQVSVSMPRLGILAMEMRKVTYNSRTGTSVFYFCLCVGLHWTSNNGVQLRVSTSPILIVSYGIAPFRSSYPDISLPLPPHQVNMMVWRLSLLATTVLSSLTLWGTFGCVYFALCHWWTTRRVSTISRWNKWHQCGNKSRPYQLFLLLIILCLLFHSSAAFWKSSLHECRCNLACKPR